jgi:hypothetical protein
MEAAGMYLNETWQWLLDTYGHTTVLVAGTTLAHEGTWILYNLPYTILALAKIPWFEQYRIQKVRTNPSLSFSPFVDVFVC